MMRCMVINIRTVLRGKLFSKYLVYFKPVCHTDADDDDDYARIPPFESELKSFLAISLYLECP